MEKLEGALLGLVALGVKTLESLLARGVLLLADDATLLSLHQILLGESTGSVLGSSVEHLGLGAHGDHLSTNHRGVVAVIIVAILTSGVHFYISTVEINTSGLKKLKIKGGVLHFTSNDNRKQVFRTRNL